MEKYAFEISITLSLWASIILFAASQYFGETSSAVSFVNYLSLMLVAISGIILWGKTKPFILGSKLGKGIVITLVALPLGVVSLLAMPPDQHASIAGKVAALLFALSSSSLLVIGVSLIIRAAIEWPKNFFPKGKANVGVALGAGAAILTLLSATLQLIPPILGLFK